MSAKSKKIKKAHLLIALCWLVYACSYIGKLSYNANISQIGLDFGVSYAECGMVSTFFFFAYGIGQVVNGFLCKRYNVKYVIFGSLAVASAMNISVTLVSDFSLIKYIWLINGVAMSFLWTSLIRLLSETLHDEDMNTAIIAMGTTVATGTFLVYGMSSLFAAIASYQLTFIIAAAAMLTVSFIWLFSYNRLTDAERNGGKDAAEHAPHIHGKVSGGVYLLIVVLAFFAVANNFMKDGLTSWTPDILSKLYNTPGWLSILLTLLLPIMAIMGTVVAVNLQKKTKNFVLTVTLLFLISAVLMGVVIGFISTPYLIITIVCFAIVSCLMAGVNNVITSMVPLSMKGDMNSGKMAGILNGFCYLGSTLSSYGLGVIADAFGWVAVFVTLLGVSVFVITIGCIYIIHNKIKRGANR